MLIRRRKVTIEIQQQTVRMEISPCAPSTPGAAANKASTAGPMETPVPAKPLADFLQQPPPDTCSKAPLLPPVSKDLQ